MLTDYDKSERKFIWEYLFWMTEGSLIILKIGSGFYKHTIPYKPTENVTDTADSLCRYVVSLLSQGVDKIFLYSMHCHSYFPQSDLC